MTNLAERAAEMRLIALLFERPTEGTRRQARELTHEIRDPALREITGRLEGIDEATHVALFGPGGPVSPREVTYRRREDPGWIMADISAFYRAFAYRPVAEEPIDHVAVEAGYVGYLWVKEIYAAGREDATAVTASARTRFLEGHLSVLASGLVARLQAVQAPAFLDLARALWERVGGRVLPTDEPYDSDADEGMTCGPCGFPTGGERVP